MRRMKMLIPALELFSPSPKLKLNNLRLGL